MVKYLFKQTILSLFTHSVCDEKVKTIKKKKFSKILKLFFSKINTSCKCDYFLILGFQENEVSQLICLDSK